MDATQLKRCIGNRLRTLRRQQDLSQERLAELSELHPTYISRIESGKSLPALDVLMRICSALSCNISEFLLVGEGDDTSRNIEGSSEAVTPAHIYGLLDTCTPAQLRLIKGLVEVVRRTPM